jgi:polyisoprenoid-binding protein YceI
MMISKVRGKFDTFEGEIVTGEDATGSSARLSVDLRSINTGNGDRDDDLRSSNYLEVDSNPTLTYQSTAIQPDGDAFVVEGDLTIKGITKSVPLRVEPHGVTKDPWGGTRAGLSATGEINRKDFGVTFDMPMDGGGLVVGEKITLQLEIEAVLQE